VLREGAACCAPTTENVGQGSRFFEDAFVVRLVGGDDVVGGVVFLGIEAGDLAHFAAAVGAGQDFDGVAGGFLHVSWFYQKSIRCMLDDFADAAGVCGDDRDFAGDAKTVPASKEKRDSSTARPGAHKPGARKNRVASLGMTGAGASCGSETGRKKKPGRFARNDRWWRTE
jgi:hypothetical protein